MPSGGDWAIQRSGAVLMEGTELCSLTDSKLTHLLEANGKLRLKVEACEHNIAETSDAIEVHDASRT